MKVLENNTVLAMMEAYVKLLNNEDYRKLESFVESHGGLTSDTLKITAEVVSAVRRFVDINLANAYAHHQKADWRGINSIANLQTQGNAIVVDGAGDTDSQIILDWQTWAAKSMPSSVTENLIGVNAEVVSIWFFNNAAKTYNNIRELLTIMGSATESKAVFSQLEQAQRADLKAWATNLLPAASSSAKSATTASNTSPSHVDSSAAVLDNLGFAIGNLCPQNLEKDSYQVLRYTYSRLRSWGKSISRGGLLQLKGTLTSKTSRAMADGNWLSSQYIALLASQFGHIEERLGVSNQIQVQLLSNDTLVACKLDPRRAVNINLKGQSLQTSVFEQIRNLALLKSALVELNRQVLKTISEWQLTDQISSAEANLAHASAQLVFNAAAGITGFFSAKASTAIGLIGQAQDEMFKAQSAYPAAIEAARVDYLKEYYSRIEAYLNMIVGNYQLTRDFSS